MERIVLMASTISLIVCCSITLLFSRFYGFMVQSYGHKNTLPRNDPAG